MQTYVEIFKQFQSANCLRPDKGQGFIRILPKMASSEYVYILPLAGLAFSLEAPIWTKLQNQEVILLKIYKQSKT